MKHIPSENRILVSLSEFISIARRRISPALPTDESEPILQDASKIALSSLGIKEQKKLEYTFDYDGIGYRIVGYADDLCTGTVTLVKNITGSSSKPKKAESAQARGEAFVLGKILCEKDWLDKVTIKLIYINTQSGASEINEETVEKKTLDTFFTKCAKAISSFATPEIENVNWWNVADGTAAPGGPPWDENNCRGGLFHHDMTPKLSALELKRLFDEEWHTELDLVTDEDGRIQFRGFYGDYVADFAGQSLPFDLHKDGVAYSIHRA